MKSRFVKALCALGFAGLLAVGVAALTTTANAKPKKPKDPLCGPTILYECTFRDGSTQLVGLTACEVERYEKKNKATCVPSAG